MLNIKKLHWIIILFETLFKNRPQIYRGTRLLIKKDDRDFGTLCVSDWRQRCQSIEHFGFWYFHFRHHPWYTWWCPDSSSVDLSRCPPRACVPNMARGARSRKGTAVDWLLYLGFKQKEKERPLRESFENARRGPDPAADCSFFEGMVLLPHPPRAPSARFPPNSLPFFPPPDAPLSVTWDRRIPTSLISLRDATGRPLPRSS